MKRKLTSEDYAFMNSLNAAIAEQSPKRMRWALYFWLVATALFIAWASLTQIDEITRGAGEVVPSGDNQMIQNLEGGIIKEILVKVGENVKRGQPLLKIDNLKSEAQHNVSNIKQLELQAKIFRLVAEAEGDQFNVPFDTEQTMPKLIHNERSLFLSRQKQIQAKMHALEDKKRQKKQELKSTIQRIVSLRRSVSLIDEEVQMTKPMVEQGVKSKVAFMKLQREQNKLQEDLNTAESSIPSIEAGISEITNNMKEAKSDFRNQAKEELNEVTAEAMRVKESSEALGDQMERTTVRSPGKGIIQKLYVHTIGGVIQPGEDLIEIVPTDDMLWLEVKIKPSDIAFIYPGQKTIIKVSAYDFAIYGSLEGEVVHIAADTSTDKKDNVFYTIHIKTDKNYLGSEKKPLKIIPGMTVNVDILTGKKSVMDYILKPILKAKQYTFTER